ncbi:NADP-dependent succinate-semialdehyde dehydrogenase [Chromobacterium vaccinii]|uniref:NADP-dependent succinate-semialdehyde dehydrogenase n=1 Tax=Chromobacterium vaccinii TaxID=1108595 RepID=UPI0009F6DCAC|nr:NADP-dependent succinate-semialdehyde dehydrogenase [Chromobacterium vaccinii]QND83337.1 Succinate-semialdehyde dehydrogenase (NAD(P)+) [Chromobacterium vaccinii]QND88568.1 Succinate-semialdehyde dehydrogenase (NAD(P)+) [Chromobacterium vaccinii]SUX54661.1 Succinate-semialdehyde dehydrogenase [NADP(+)] GabD [Chromobacterium vaccinii]
MLNLQDPKLLRQQCYLDGQWLDADNGQSIAVQNPATGETVGQVPKMGAAEAERAVAAAARAFPAWKAKSAKERAAILRRWFDLIIAHQQDLAVILTSEQGKPLAEAKGEIAYGASYIEWYAEEAKRVYGDIVPGPAGDRRVLVTKEPIGVTAAITPWNFPSAMITRKAAPALAAGCTMVVRPASQTPLSALALAELAERAGIPPGVFSVITGGSSEIGAVLTGSDAVKKFSFTGSTEVGRKLIAQCAGTVKKVSMELGGNAPFIVFDDADLDAAVEGALISKYRNAGQTCVCANRIYVQDGVYDAFADKFAAAVATLKVGNGLEAGVSQGPLIDQNAVAKVEEHIADALAKGGRLIAGGKRHALGHSFFEPTLIADVTRDMKVAREETFGPLAPLFRFKTEEEAIRLANDTEFGLASYFYARDVGRIFRVAEGLEYGMVAVNSGLLSNEAAPFGGVKQSGLGREGSKYGIEDYLEIKYVLLGGLDR